VITSDNSSKTATLPLEVPDTIVHTTRHINLNYIPELIFGGKKKVAHQGYGSVVGKVRLISLIYRSFLHVPDEMAGWIPFAVQAGKKLLSSWKPDLIYCSGMPFSGFIISRRLSQIYQIPWVAEYRDLWSQNSSYDYLPWRRKLDRLIEMPTVRSANALVAVTPTLAEKLGRLFSQPIEVIYNGFDPQDYSGLAGVEQRQDNLLKIVYTGTIYRGYQDIRPLFQALSMLGDQKKDIEVIVYSRYFNDLVQMALQIGVSGCLKTPGVIPYRDCLQSQRQADILLYLGWNDPIEKGVFAGKLFEYLGARRPILVVGPGKDLPSDLICQRQAGFISNDPAAIAAQLDGWLKQKAAQRIIPDLPQSVGAGFSRQEQFARLETFLSGIIARQPE
jgi:hypothetical protein